MGYRVVDTAAVEPEPERPSTCRKLADPAGLDELALNRFRAAPGEQVPLAYHYHETQQEAFYVLSGTLVVETPDEQYTVEADELFVVDPRSPQRAHNPKTAETAVELLAIGVPPVADDAVVYEPTAADADPDDE